MSSFPALDDQPTNTSGNLDGVEDTDFLKREQEILGNEFKTEKDEEIIHDLENSEDEEVNVFKQQFPELENQAKQDGGATEIEEEFADFEESKPVHKEEAVQVTSSEAIDNWKQRRDLELKERDDQDLAKKEVLKKEAIEQVDLLYEEYEAKKLSTLKETKLKEEEFKKERQEFFKGNDGFDARSNVSWKKALQLLDGLDSLSETAGGRDRSKFKELLVKLSAK